MTVDVLYVLQVVLSTAASRRQRTVPVAVSRNRMTPLSPRNWIR
jgi:hypothetical protein